MAKMRRPKRRLFFIYLAVAALIGGIAISSTAYSNYAQTNVKVVRVIDGDTIVVSRGSKEVTIRLLNIDTPELTGDNKQPECLAVDAKEFLINLLPAGTKIKLEHDIERHDRYGRELAGIFLQDRLINAEIAAAGLGVPMLIEPNERFYSQVSMAMQEAELEQRGLFDPNIECTYEAQIMQALTETAEVVEPAANSAMAELNAQESKVTEALATLAALYAITAGDDHRIIPNFRPAYLLELRNRIDTEHTRISEIQENLNEAIEIEKERLQVLEEERKAKEEAARKAKEEAERQKKVEAERKAKEEADRKAAAKAAAEAQKKQAQQQGTQSKPATQPKPAPQPAPAKPQPPAQKPAAPNNSNPHRAPCRAYSGKTYKYIDCTTKIPIDGIVRTD